MLTDRSKKIIQSIAKQPFGNSVPLGVIADDIDISVRSIQRELSDIESWMNKNGFHFERKRGQGLLLNEDESRKNELLLLLDKGEAPNYSIDRDARQKDLIEDLLFTEEPKKSYYYTDLYQISEKTFTNDLNQVTRWFRKYKLDLIRRPGLGIFVSGSELSMRRAVTSVINKKVDDTASMLKLRNIHYLSYEELDDISLKPLDSSYLQEVASIFYEVLNQLNLTLPDSEYVHCLLYITISLYRIEKGKLLTEQDSLPSNINMEPEYAVAEQLCNIFQKDLDISIPPKEVAYVALALTGLHLWRDTQWDLTEKRELIIRNAIVTLMNNIGDALHTDFSTDNDLLIDLTNHIRPMIGRLRAGIPTENPLLGTLISDYPDIFQACKEALKAATEEIGLPQAPDSEVGFITMHFGASIERKRQMAHKIRTVVVCPCGIGTSRLLSAYLQKEYPQLKILGVRAASSLNVDSLQNEHVDLIVSTIHLDIPYEKVQISPILTKQDKLLLNAKLDTMEHTRSEAPHKVMIQPASIARDDVDYITTLGNELFEVLNHISVGLAPVLHSKDEIISYAASLFAKDEEMEAELQDVILRREALGDTYIRQLHVLLLHGKSSTIDHCCFGYVRLKPPVYQDGKMILGAIVSFVPEDDKNFICTSLLSEIIGSLIEGREFTDQLREGDVESIRTLVEEILLKFYQRKVRELIH